MKQFIELDPEDYEVRRGKGKIIVRPSYIMEIQEKFNSDGTFGYTTISLGTDGEGYANVQQRADEIKKLMEEAREII